MLCGCIIYAPGPHASVRVEFNSFLLTLFAIFLILTSTQVSFAGPPPDRTIIVPNPATNSAPELANRDANGPCDQSPVSSPGRAGSKATTAVEHEEDDTPSAASLSAQRGIGSVNQVNHAQLGKARTDVTEVQNGKSDDDDDDDAEVQQLTGCDRHDEKKTAVSRVTPADDDDEDDDGDDNDSDAKQGKDSDPEAVPGIESHFDFYRDTDGNLTVTAGSIATSLLGDGLLQMRKDELMARDGVGTERVGSTLLTVREKTSEGLTLIGSLGTITAFAWQSAVGGVKATQTMGNLSVTLNAAREMVGGTAQAIRERVMRDGLGVYLYNDFTDHISAEASFHQYIYSDGNRSDQAEFSPQYEILLKRSQLAFGYALTYRSFAETVDRGYNDPRRLLSNDLTATWKFDRGNYYGNLEASGGRVLVAGAAPGQGATGSGMGESSVATLGLRFTRSSRLETYWSNELYPGWSSTGFGFRLCYDF